jgi:ferric-dicitrate binding protein FerR (iron transport regulator)
VETLEPRPPRWLAAHVLDEAIREAREASYASSLDERTLEVRLAAARTLDALFDDVRDPAPSLDHAQLEEGLAAKLAAVHALDTTLGDVREPTFELDLARLEAGLATKLASVEGALDDEHDEDDDLDDDAPVSIPTRALAAYAAGRLSPEGRRRVEDRAREVPEVGAALARARALGELRREADRTAREAVEGARLETLELPLRREVARLDAQRRSRRLVGGLVLGLAAAAAFALLVLQGPAPEPLAVREPEPEPIVLPIPELAAEVTGLAGEVLVEGRDEPLSLGDPLREGDVVRVAGVLHGRLDEGTGVVVEPGPSAIARLRFDHLREDGIELALVEGRVASEVRTGTPYSVVAGDFRIEVRGTRFSVDRDGDVVAVRLDEGRVAISRDGVVVAELEAPAEWRSSDALDPPGAVARPRALALDALRWPVFRLPTGRFVEVEIDGTVVSAAEGVALRVPRGDHDVVAVDAEGRVHRGLVSVDEGFVLDERALVAERVAPRRGYLPPEVIRSVVAPRTDALKRCYERTLRRTSQDLAGSYVLRVQVGADGNVRRVRIVTDGESPPPFVTCLQLEAQSWSFPKPEGDGPVTFDLPLAFSARGL